MHWSFLLDGFSMIHACPRVEPRSPVPVVIAGNRRTGPIDDMEAILRTLRESRQPRKLGEEVVYTKSTWREVE